MNNKIITTIIVVFSILLVITGKFYYDSKVQAIGDKAKTEQQENLKKEQEQKVTALNNLYKKLEKVNLEGIEVKTIGMDIFDKLNQGDLVTIVFLGDSTTEQNDMTNGKPGHVNIILNNLKAIYGNDLKIVNSGVGGNTIVDMESRLTESVIKHNPDLVVMNAGLNDVARLEDSEFEKHYSTVIETIQKKTNAKIYLRTSNYTDTEKTNEVFEDEFNDIVKNLATKYNLGFIDLYEFYKDAVISNGDIYQYNKDSYHPNENGQQLISNVVLKTLLKDYIEK